MSDISPPPKVGVTGPGAGGGLLLLRLDFCDRVLLQCGGHQQEVHLLQLIRFSSFC